MFVVLRKRASWRLLPKLHDEILLYRKSPRAQMSELQFTQHVNPVTGKMEWVAQNKDEYDYFRDVARSSYADMLHDTERNQMYYNAIRLAVAGMHARGKKAKVLDIGTGTGLLSMMAATAGADTITAIEVFGPMARVAKQITKVNRFDKIKVVNKHSTEVSVGENEDMQERANILITELFDTELIGEGALEAYQHAHQNLMEEDCIAVPHSATTFVQLVESDVMNSWHALEPIKIQLKNGTVKYIEPDPRMKECPGVPAVHDIQLSQVKRSQFKEITEPMEVFKFEWGSKAISSASRTCVVETKAIETGKAQVVLSWWTLCMDQAGNIILSTAPYWYHPSPDNMQWRDHWIQSVYFLPRSFDVKQGESIYVSAFHDAYSMWFDAKLLKSEIISENTMSRPRCDYLPRMLWSRPRLGMLNDQNRNAAFAKALEKVNHGSADNHIAVCISDVTPLPLLAARTCFSKGKIYSLETDAIGQKGIQKLLEHNDLSDRITVVNSFSKGDDGAESVFHEKSINLLVGEPFFNASLLPWHDLRFWYARSDLNEYLKQTARIMPCRAHLRMVAVQFEDLWNIRAPVGTVEGFDVSIMDKMIDHAMEMQEYHEPEPHALWEYPCTLLSKISSIMTFDIMKPIPHDKIVATGNTELTEATECDTCHGFALWMDYDLDDEISITTGIRDEGSSRPTWNMHHKQAVFFLRQPITVKGSHKIDYEMSFIPGTGEVKMKFKADSS